jgi:hypothetical protein
MIKIVQPQFYCRNTTTNHRLQFFAQISEGNNAGISKGI